jgi:hypothetical protein
MFSQYNELESMGCEQRYNPVFDTSTLCALILFSFLQVALPLAIVPTVEASEIDFHSSRG